MEKLIRVDTNDTYEFKVPFRGEKFQDKVFKKWHLSIESYLKNELLEILEELKVKLSSKGNKISVELVFPRPINKTLFREICIDVVANEGYSFLVDASCPKAYLKFMRCEPTEYIGVWLSEDGTESLVSGAIYQYEIGEVNG